MEWLLWPAGVFVVLIFLSALPPQHKTSTQLFQVALGLIMLAFLVKWGWSLFTTAWAATDDIMQTGLAWLGLIYLVVMSALLTPWARDDA